ncbi:MAG: proprotein convertase P-domain-containing protein [Pseudomonadota bacterium]
MNKLYTIFFGILFVVAIGACAETMDDGAGNKPETNGKDPALAADQWNAGNNPTQFHVEFEYKYADLKQYTTGRAEQLPWPSDYWSYYQDSINVRYKGISTTDWTKLSPVEKYDIAFNNWQPPEGFLELMPIELSVACGVPEGAEGDKAYPQVIDKHNEYYNALGPAATWQHKNKGNWKARNGKDDDGDGFTDECTNAEDGDDHSDYDGIETWWGLCHAWVPAAILAAEPQHDVTINGVTFTVSDIKALLIAMYDRSAAHMLGGRCNDFELERDEAGRPLNEDCRDTNAGSFHVVITNMLGKMKRAFAEDRTIGYQVWNQPILGYQITKDQELTEAEVMTKLGHPGEKFHDIFNSKNAVKWVYFEMNVDYLSESSADVDGPLIPNIGTYTNTDHYKYIVEIDKDDLIVGGEWVSYNTIPDFLWLPIRTYGGNPEMSLAKVEHLLELSIEDTQPEPIDEDIVEVRFTFGADMQIPDNNATGFSYNLPVDEDLTIASMKVYLDVKHSYIGDLKITMEKDGTSVVLHDNSGGGNDDIQKTYDVANFNGAASKGDWKLVIVDNAGQDTGYLAEVKLMFSTAAPLSGDTKTYSNDTSVAIPDKNAAGVKSVIAVTDDGKIKSLKVTVTITHTYIGDLIVKLVKGGQEQALHSREGGSADDLAKTFDVDAFNGADAKGDWTLFVSDNAGQDLGTLEGWELEIEL